MGQAATPAPPQDAEIKAFEKWYEADVMPMEADWFRRDKDGDYEHTPTYDAWRGWMARAASERAQDWRKMSIVEIACENQSVADYVKHWEGRAESAERELEKLKKKVQQ